MVTKIKSAAVIVAVTIIFTSCNKCDISAMFWATKPNVEERVAQSLDYNRQHGDITISLLSDNYRFYVCGDVHNDVYPHQFDKMMRVQRNDSTAAFGLTIGDLVTTAGTMHIVDEVAKYNPASDRFNTPEFFIVGNHDLFFDQWEDFMRLFGSSTYSFVVVTPHYKDLYIMLDSGSGTHGKTQLKWMCDLLKNRGNYRHCVVCTHVNLFRTDLSQVVSGGYAIEEVYELVDIMSKNNVELVLQGHDHNRKTTVLDGCTYLTLDCLKDTGKNISYVIVDAGERLDYHFVDVQ